MGNSGADGFRFMTTTVLLLLVPVETLPAFVIEPYLTTVAPDMSFGKNLYICWQVLFYFDYTYGRTR